MIYNCISIVASILTILAVYYYVSRLGLLNINRTGINDVYLKSADGRIIWIDLAKGIAILLVIAGHTVYPPRDDSERMFFIALYSFHVPLFFIISSMVFRLSADERQFVISAEKSFKYLIIPAVSVFFLRIIFSFNTGVDLSYWKIYAVNLINALVYSSAVEAHIFDMPIPVMGRIWFLIVLFCGKVLFDYLHLRIKGRLFVWAVVICTLAGVLLGQLQCLPFSFDITMAIMLLFLCGYSLKGYDFTKRKYLGFSVFFGIWLLSFMLTYVVFGKYQIVNYFGLGERQYTFFPLCYVTAVSGSMAIAYLCQIIVSYCSNLKALLFLGRHTLCLLCVHYLDDLYKVLWFRSNNLYFNSLIRMIIDVSVCIVLLKIGDIFKSRGWLKH